ncbi:hypothetical protein [Pseudomonas putida]|uniref:hypothetical protein n=1 Tax=Pseudomonas putida TaxID=303 RepID=UPI00128E6E62|nr:hypothetical protein [Pseudomonas putida]
MLKPINSAHSIETISLSCEYDGDVSSVGLSVIKEEATRLKLKYQHRRVARRSPSSSDSLSSDKPEIFGYLFSSKDGERDISKLEIIEDNSSATSFAYTNFKSFIADVSFGLICAHKAFVNSGRSLQKVVLSYRNSFLAENATEINSAIRRPSRYVAEACLAQDNFWHSRIGFFSNEPYKYPIVLHNISLAHKLLQEEDEINEGVELVHRLQIDSHHVFGVKDPVSIEDFESFLEDKAHYLRDKNSEILGGMINDDVMSLIGLPKR